ncbi:MAG TPA: signal peptidase I, partial [Granulicella sp.]|nr:signal peptidase I [Granulicella sp.]
VIVFHYPIDPSMHLIKRIIGLPGDHLRLRNGRVFIDGQPLLEPYTLYQPGPADNFRDNFPRLQNPDPDVSSNWWIEMKQLVNRGELTVPPGQYFVLGDNRNDSEDSRYWGFVPASAIVGRPLLIYFSLSEPDEPGRADLSDEPAAPRLTPVVPIHSSQPSPLDLLFHLTRFARWSRTFRIVH